MLAETICSAAAAAGLGIAAVTAYRKRYLTAARIAAYALVPLGLVLTGAVGWLAGTAFSPVAWLGVGLLGLSWVLFSTTRRMERRALEKQAQEDPAIPGSETAGKQSGQISPGRRGKPVKRSKQSTTGAAAGGDDFSDVEAILKKHGI
ncbi:hypothetical protein ABZ532_21345 [Streptomyces sp. NPDC019396]|uniref:hypothetical protein n=1 Tax=Streptomyces sp. NPDC019396 TaxID=3154687 RepID=UPI0033EECE9F